MRVAARRSMLFWLGLAALWTTWAPSAARVVTAQQPVCFPETGQCLEGRFRAYWEQNGGLPVFGLPVTPARDEINRDTGQSYLTQWFERNRFEFHPENRAPYDVLLGRLGDDRLQQIGRAWQAGPRERGQKSGCLWFAETGHNVCDQASGRGFRSYWQSNGLRVPNLASAAQSLALFGLPLTEARMEINTSGDNVLTQWFERARLEWHPDKPAQYQVLLGRMGSEIGPISTSIARVSVLKDKGRRPDWSRKYDLIAFDKPGDDGNSQVYTTKPDGSGEQCLTCAKPGAPPRHKGNPAWHPLGDYLAFQAEKPEHPGSSWSSTPGLGKDNDIWLMTRDGNQYYQLTNLPLKRAVLHPQFSNDGTKFIWAEMVETWDTTENITGSWAIKLADFVVDASGPRLANVRTLQPLGPVTYETHGFSPDDTKILFTAYFQPDQRPGAWMDVYILDLATSVVKPLTESSADWDEHARYSPSGNKIIWMSSTACNCNPKALNNLRTDLWLAKADGSGKSRLTSLSVSGRLEFVGARSIAGDNAWSPDGKKLALYVIETSPGASQMTRQEKLLIIEFDTPQ